MVKQDVKPLALTHSTRLYCTGDERIRYTSQVRISTVKGFIWYVTLFGKIFTMKKETEIIRNLPFRHCFQCAIILFRMFFWVFFSVCEATTRQLCRHGFLSEGCPRSRCAPDPCRVSQLTGSDATLDAINLYIGKMHAAFESIMNLHRTLLSRNLPVY